MDQRSNRSRPLKVFGDQNSQDQSIGIPVSALAIRYDVSAEHSQRKSTDEFALYHVGELRSFTLNKNSPSIPLYIEVSHVRVA